MNVETAAPFVGLRFLFASSRRDSSRWKPLCLAIGHGSELSGRQEVWYAGQGEARGPVTLELRRNGESNAQEKSEN